MNVSGLENIPKTGAVLLAANHPNSFFDAILLACLFDRPMWSLARGDAFKNKGMNAFFRSIKMMPIHRLSEGKEFLGENDLTFSQCMKLFRAGEMVLIFPEGLCVHQTQLLPLKKGTARLVQKAWSEDLPLQVIPIRLKYDSFTRFGKTIYISIESPVDKSDFPTFSLNGFFLNEFNRILAERLATLNPKETPVGFSENPVYYLGRLLNFPLYFLCQLLSRQFTKGTVFYDSVLFGAMIFLSPLYWAAIVALVFKLF